MYAYAQKFENNKLCFDDLNECPMCNRKLEVADELEHTIEQGVCQRCLSDLVLEAAEDTIGLW